MRRSYQRAPLWGCVIFLGLACACGDDGEAYGGSSLDTAGGAAGRPAIQQPQPTQQRLPQQPQQTCFRGQLASGLDPQVAASVCVGLPYAGSSAGLRCTRLAGPDARGAGLVVCDIPSTKAAYVVNWQSSASAEAVVGNNRLEATLRKVTANDYLLRYQNGTQAQCTIAGTSLTFCR